MKLWGLGCVQSNLGEKLWSIAHPSHMERCMSEYMYKCFALTCMQLSRTYGDTKNATVWKTTFRNGKSDPPIPPIEKPLVDIGRRPSIMHVWGSIFFWNFFGFFKNLMPILRNIIRNFCETPHRGPIPLALLLITFAAVNVADRQFLLLAKML